jgi:O-antigen/teichoic acid export membrane protein
VTRPETSRRRANTPGLGGWARKLASAARSHVSDPLSRGGLALLINTGLTGILGFGYWIVAARHFSTYAVGVAGALVAATTLFSGIGQLNLSGMLMRFLPAAGGKSRRMVLATYAFAAVASALIAAVSLAAIRVSASRGSPLHLGELQSAAVVLAVAATAIFTIEDNVLVALRRAVWVPVENGAFGAAKIISLFVLAPVSTAFALYGAWMIPLALTVPMISALLFWGFLPPASRPRRAARLGQELRGKIIRFAVGDAAGGLFTQAWTYLLPVIVTTSLGASADALFYTSFLFSSTIDQIAANYASPMTVEGAHAPEDTGRLIRLALRRIFTIVVPVVAVLLIISPWLLSAFGKKYVSAVPLLDVLLIACLPKALSTVYYAYCRIERTTHRSASLQACVCIATLSAVPLVARSFGLVGVGSAVVSVQACAGVVSGWALQRGLRHGAGAASRRGRHRRQRPSHARADSARLSITGR